MPRTIGERLRDPVWWLEQSAHAWLGWGAGWLASIVALTFSHSYGCAALSGVLGAIVVGVVREVIQNAGDDDTSIHTVLDATFDAAFTALGGFLEALPWVVVWRLG